jgi:small subunit ribosomal protein S1
MDLHAFFMENLTSPAISGGSDSSFDETAQPSEQNPEQNSFGDILSEFEQHHHGPPRGEAIPGHVVSITADSVFVDIGRKLDGVLPVEFFRGPSGELTIKVGDRLLVNITGNDGEAYTLSTLKVERPKDWTAFEKAFADGTPIAGVVKEVVKGGLRVDVGVEAFMPASRSGAREQADVDKLVGQEIQCKIIKLDTAGEDIVVDRRVVLEQEEAKARDKRFSELAEGAVVRGTVRSLTDFGAFVDLGGVDGLLHVADMAWYRVAKPSDVVAIGDSVEVKILKVQPGTRRISLGLKQLQPDPWTLAGERFHTGDRVQGKVSRLADFGAFVELAPGVDGLIHVSEMSWTKKVKKPSDLLKVGELVDAVVLGVTVAERRISLGLKQALGDPWDEAQKKFAVGAVAEGPVTSLTNFGCFVDLGEGIEGMIHISDITREKRLNHPREALTVGQVVKAQVLELDKERRRIKLGMKQLVPTSVDEYLSEHAVGETVTGRVVEASAGRAKVELGEGIFGECKITAEAKVPEASSGTAPSVDLSSLTAMLSAKWKQGPSAAATRMEPARAGQVRSFKLTRLDAAAKKIELELAG